MPSPERKEAGSTEALLRAIRLARHFKLGPVTVRALKGVSFQVQAGDFVAVVGGSGSGKSTLMNIVGLLDRPTSGEFYIEGEEVSRLNDRSLSRIRNQAIGFVFQSFHLLSRLTAAENVELPLIYQGVPARERRNRALQLLERVGLRDREDHRPLQLSGGQQQRVAIARALVTRPRLLLADEPTGALDPAMTQDILTLFTELNNQDGVSIMIITHDMKVAARTKRVIRIQDGNIVNGS